MTNYIQTLPGKEIDLGKRGENLARCAMFDISGWVNTYGEGTVHLLHQRNGDKAPYPCVIETEGTDVLWHITDADVEMAGRGRAELQYFVGEARVKSETWVTRTGRCLDTSGPKPEEPAITWINTMMELGTDVQENAAAADQSAQDAKGSADVSAQSARDAAGSAETAGSYMQTAGNYASNAELYMNDAMDAARDAQDARDEAIRSKEDADSSAESAERSAKRAETVRDSIVVDEERLAQAVELADYSAAGAAISAGEAQASELAAARSQEAAEDAVGKVPYIGDDGYWYRWDAAAKNFLNTGVKAQGKKGDTGKTAYEYAKDADYLGTEADFANKMAVEMIDWFGVGINIVDCEHGLDLNNYKTPGKYYVRTETDAKTIVNRPPGMNTNFCMYVFYRTDEVDLVVTQHIFTLNSKQYLRSTSTSKWRDWTSYATSEEIDALFAQVMADLSNEVVKVTEQNWTDAQKAQARANIGAVSAYEVITWQAQADWDQPDMGEADFIHNKPMGKDGGKVWVEQDYMDYIKADVLSDVPIHEQVQADWDQQDEEAPDFIHNRPMRMGLTGKVFIKDDYLDAIKEAVFDDMPPITEQAQADWNQNDPAQPDYVKNRPMYAAAGTTVVEEQSGEMLEEEELGGWYAELFGEHPKAGETYRVTYNGTEYLCTAYNLYKLDGRFNGVAIGNVGVCHAANFGEEYENKGNGEPFAIEIGGDLYGFYLYTAGPGSYTIKVQLKGEPAVIKPEYMDAIKEAVFDDMPPIPEQVQPDLDQNDPNAVDYVKGRKFYRKEHSVIAEEQTVTTTDEWGEGSFATLSTQGVLEVGKTYTVMFNGTAYECVAYRPWDKEDDRIVYEDYTILGNSEHYKNALPSIEVVGNEEPFAIVQLYGSVDVYVAKDGTYTVKATEKDGLVIEPLFEEAVKAVLPTVELTATLEDGTTQTIKLYGEVVTG